MSAKTRKPKKGKQEYRPTNLSRPGTQLRPEEEMIELVMSLAAVLKKKGLAEFKKIEIEEAGGIKQTYFCIAFPTSQWEIRKEDNHRVIRLIPNAPSGVGSLETGVGNDLENAGASVGSAENEEKK